MNNVANSPSEPVKLLIGDEIVPMRAAIPPSNPVSSVNTSTSSQNSASYSAEPRKLFLFLLVLKPNKTPIYCVLSFSQPPSLQVAMASHLRKSRVTIPADPLSVPNIAQVGSEKSSPALRESIEVR